LGFQNFSFDQGDFERLAQSTILSRLERLTLVGTSAGSSDRLSGLLPALPSETLDRLALGALWTDANARPIIDRIPAMPHLTQLDLPNNPLGDISLESLLERLPKLTHLNLGGTGLSDVVLRSIMNSSRLRQLHWLDLSGATISDQCAIDLLDSASFGGLTRLNLRGTALSEPVQRALRVRLEDRVLL
jgi:Leucine-rich repeat (LRR) protein